jgi:hypothetical protein
MARVHRVDLLLIDDLGLHRLKATETGDFYELIVERHRLASTIITSNRIQDDPTTFRIAIRLEADSLVLTATLDAHGIFDITAPIAAGIAELTLADIFARERRLRARAGHRRPARIPRRPRRARSLVTSLVARQLQRRSWRPRRVP